jgi:hypothetical protein
MAENQLVALNDSDELDFGYSKAFFCLHEALHI